MKYGRVGLILSQIISWGCTQSEGAATVDIVNGVPVTADELERLHTVALTRGGRPFCTGTYIHENWVLTATHCIIDHAVAQATVTVEFGRGVLPRNQQVRAIGLPIPHPDYTDTNRNDIALIRLWNAPDLSNFQPSRIPVAADGVAVGDDVILAGYGDVGFKVSNAGGRLLKTQVNIRKIDPVKRFIHFESLKSNNSSCHGDSGGPMFLEKDGELITIGVTQGVDPDPSKSFLCSKFGIYTDVLSFKDWLGQTRVEIDRIIAEKETQAAEDGN